jgi:phosphate transport system substrate-binding protein
VNRLLLIGVAAALSSLAGVAASVSGRFSYAAAADVQGEFHAVGPDTMEAVMNKWIAAFRQRQPGAKISFDVAGVDARDRIAIGPATEEVFASTNEPFVRRHGYEPFRVMVSLATFNTPQRVQALGIFVHPANPLTHLSLAQLERIYSAAHRRSSGRPIKTWGDVGLTGEWAGRPIHAYSRQLDNEVTTHLREVVCRGAEFHRDVKVPGKGVSVDVLGAVAADLGGIGFAGFAYQTAGVRPLALGESEAGPFYEPTLENCAANRYPLDRPFYFYVNRRPGAPLDPLVREFISYVLSAEGQQLNAEEKYLPLTPELAAAQRAKLN